MPPDRAVLFHQGDGVARAPWTSAQCNRISDHQSNPRVHQLTCEYHSEVPLNVGLRGLWCGMPTCDYTQDWVHAGIAGRR